ncbi:EAL domain-containing protein [Vibrio anguillarum]|nr:EAL domain-containing protein [Vibrio anguillarum]MBT2911404.1 EAL domain-containing protein [Vibrio anguillarum]MBT2926869.1 EAL domain-containing protein [Vibrio anguillarum]MBT2932939.1 EAL domain-containing protein [Vibrio anguillarum]MBT2937760.1 EAL domain-containing protein [Vibrio anguillarum]MBT2940657.1 EAL domain-containing protein [Vibrio anguillarum]
MQQQQVHMDQRICQQCSEKQSLPFDFTMAFQPIVNVADNTIFGYEALVRGLNNESAYSIIEQVSDDNRYRFDQLCRIKAIKLAAKLKLSGILSINFLPNAVYQPERCIRTTLEAAKQFGFPTERIMFEFTEVEKIVDTAHIKRIVAYYSNLGFTTAIDDFGAGYAGLGLLVNFQTKIVKLDMSLLRNIDQDITKQAIVRHTVAMLIELGIRPLAEGIETQQEMLWLKRLGIELMQGYYFAKPEFEALPTVTF